MNRKNFILWILGLGLLAVTCILSDIITLGDKLSSVHPWLSYTFYALIALLVLFLM